jgi:hypothetical protein
MEYGLGGLGHISKARNLNFTNQVEIPRSFASWHYMAIPGSVSKDGLTRHKQIIYLE